MGVAAPEARAEGQVHPLAAQHVGEFAKVSPLSGIDVRVLCEGFLSLVVRVPSPLSMQGLQEELCT